MMEPYEYADKVIDALDMQIARDFIKHKEEVALIFLYDEQFYTSVTDRVNALYRKIDRNARTGYLDIAKHVYVAWLAEIGAVSGRSANKITEEFVVAVLDGYDPVTKYVYSSEIERKAARLAETVLADAKAAVDAGGRPSVRSRAIAKDYSTGHAYIERQIDQYGLTIEDAAAVKAFTDAGVKKVMWHSEQDDKTCLECLNRNTRTYPIDHIPPKPHLNCRCWLTPVNEA